MPTRRNCDNEDWHAVIRDYSARALTQNTDKLPALSGLAALYHKNTGHTYLAGLWKETIVANLNWKQNFLFGRASPPPRPALYRAPSWSWASVDGNAEYNEIPGLTQRATLVETQLLLKDSSIPFGEVESGWIKLRGPLKPARITYKMLLIEGQDSGTIVLDPVANGDIQPCEDTDGLYALLLFGRFHSDQKLKPIGEGTGLLLNTICKDLFTRVGWFYTDDNCFDSIEESTVKIV